MTYGSNKGPHSGHYWIELNSWLRNYTTVTDNQGVFNLTLYEQQADLTVKDFNYTLTHEAVEVAIPKLKFSPPLHDSLS